MDECGKLTDKIKAEQIQLEELNKSNKKATKTSVSKSKTKSFAEMNALAKSFLGDIQKSSSSVNSATTKQLEDLSSEVNKSTAATEQQTNFDKIENDREAVSDSNQKKISTENEKANEDTSKVTESDADTGFNTDRNAQDVITVLDDILSEIKTISSVISNTVPQQAGLPEGKDTKNSLEDTHKQLRETFKQLKAKNLTPEEIQSILAPIANAKKATSSNIPPELPKLPGGHGPSDNFNNDNSEDNYKKRVEKSNIYASPIKLSILDKFQMALEKATGATKKYNTILNKTADEEDQIAAERIHTWGLNNSRNPNDTGDIASMRRSLELFRTNKSSIDQNPELAQNIKLTSGVDVDTTEIMKPFIKAMSGSAMRNAQMGGSPLRQGIGYLTGFIGMPSIEKSRSIADGLNQILQETTDALQSVLTTIQAKETELSGLENKGDIKFDSEGNVLEGTSAAKKTLADLEEEKVVLRSILADQAFNNKLIEDSHGDYRKLIKTMSYSSPVLRDNNKTLRNLNAGLDESGKALKFQSRTGEILNYTFQLMSRSIGQMLKNWLSMINPINMIKKAFNDFMGYDVKWKRTMNVVKMNLQTVLRPMMEWIAQKLVNMIGFVDIISQKVQSAFGHTPISLFDQAAADTEKMRRELEEAANVSAGFDELHDIGSDNSAENDLLGDIYKPQLSQEWIDLANKIGDLFAGIIKGDLGFGDAMKLILQILGETLAAIGKMIWNWLKNTKVGKWLTDHWKALLGTLLGIFLGWKLLKLFGPTLFSAMRRTN